MKDPNRAPFYVCMYHGLCVVARNKGYALAMHGSVITDMDLVAIPWTDEAIPAEELMLALKDHIGAVDYRALLERDCEWASQEELDAMVRNSKDKAPEFKPHGRLAWNLYLYHGCKIDLSVMPRIVAEPNIP